MKKKWALLVGRWLGNASQVREDLGIGRRDLKAENILVANGEQVTLDFGYRNAALQRDETGVAMTQAAKKKAGW